MSGIKDVELLENEIDENLGRFYAEKRRRGVALKAEYTQGGIRVYIRQKKVRGGLVGEKFH
jgi:hypothetical protein